MAKVTNAFETRSAVGNREDLSDAIYNIDPTDTPFINSIGRRSVTNVVFDWQTEALASPATNAIEEGFALSRAATTATVRLSNSCQISYKDATVTGSQENMNSAGRKSEMAHQMAKRSKELKNDIEFIALSEAPRATGSGDGLRNTRAFGHWLTITSRGAGGANPASETAAATGGTDRTLTETTAGTGLRPILKTSFDAGGSASMLFTNSVQKIIIDGFTGRTNSQHAVSKDTVQASVSVYTSDFGDLRVMLDRKMNQQIIYGVDPNMVRIAFYRNFMQKPIAAIGDAETRMILAEWGVQVDNDKAHFGMYDLT